jgi:hypothetical protein
MISEIVTWCLTPCPPYVRHMGYLYQSIALRGRYLRHAKRWQPHLENTKKFILKTASACEHHDKVIILGSGLLYDVPIDDLASMFVDVVLVDIVHLAEAKRRIRDYVNVELIQSDITGVAEPLYHTAPQSLEELPESRPLVPAFDGRTSLVVSLNMVSQIATAPADYLLKKDSALQECEISAWCDSIRMAHVDLMGSLPCPVCLIADYAFAYKDRAGNRIEQGSTVGSLALPEPEQVWTWHIAPYGEDRPNCSKELIVGAWNMPSSSL